MNDEAAIDGLKRLGLTTYEARVFLALQKLGSGAASEISEVADVPRSQVYGAAEGLEERGLVEIQQSKPTIYRPVPLQQARTKLLDQLAETGSETFDYLETVQDTEEQEERAESIWVIRGEDSVTSRLVNLAGDADNQVLYATENPAHLTEDILTAFEAAADRGVTTIVGSIEDEVLEAAPDEDWLVTFPIPEERDLDVGVSRLFIADQETILLGAYAAGAAKDTEEVAFWTSENAFAAVLAELAEAFMQEPVG